MPSLILEPSAAILRAAVGPKAEPLRLARATPASRPARPIAALATRLQLPRSPAAWGARSAHAWSRADLRVRASTEEEYEEYAFDEFDSWDDIDVLVQTGHTDQDVAGMLCDMVADEAVRSIEERGAFTLAIPGGSVAKALAGLTEKEGIDWSKVHVFFVNERCPDQKNYALAKTTWADAVGLPPAQLYTIEAGSLGPVEEAERYEAILTSLPKTVMAQLKQADGTEVPSFDMILLGMGADGHIGSIYAGSPEAAASEGLVLGVVKPEKMSITMSLPLINAASGVVIAATGAKKAATVKAVLDAHDEGVESPLPAARVDPLDGIVVWLLDDAAATELAAGEEEEEEEKQQERHGNGDCECCP